MIGAVIGIAVSSNLDVKPMAFAGFVALLSGAYAVTGKYPETLPLAEVFVHREKDEPPTRRGKPQRFPSSRPRP